MQLYPAIDVKEGKCVRLLKGNMDRVTVFNDSVENQAEHFVKAGVTWLHIVDLDGAFRGKSVNDAAIKRIIDTVQVKMQLGGGIRTLQDIERWLKQGIHRVILGTCVVENPDLVKRACEEFPGHIAVSIDARGGFVAVEGWVKNTRVTILDLARKVEDFGVSAIIYTDIDRDGVSKGVNVDRTALLAKSIDIPIIASGGVKSIEDIYALQATHCGIAGVISGRALYDGSLSIQEALKACGSE